MAIDRAARWRDCRPYVLALALYLCSRLVVLLAIWFAGNYLPIWKSDLWQSGAHWYDHLLRWDSEWYAGIVEHGYHYNGDPNALQPVVFYPLYPLLSWALAAITGIGSPLALLIVANVAAVIAVLLLCKLARRFGDDVAVLSVALLSFYPGSLFLSAGYTEPLALLLILSCFTLLDDRRYLLASVAAGLALVTRSVGIALMPALLWELWFNFRTDRGRLLLYAIACMALASAGLVIYMIYLGTAFGHPLAFADAQAAFHGETSLGGRLFAALTLQPFLHLRFDDFSPAGLDQWIFILLLALTLAGSRRLPGAQVVFGLGALLVPYLTLSGGPSGLTSMTRFGVLAFPAFIMLALVCRALPWLGLAVIGLFAAMLGLDAALFAQWYWVG
ncbi:MAG: glycosyltransferase family 39 protein [Xanthobacteraceae bacterium]